MSRFEAQAGTVGFTAETFALDTLAQVDEDPFLKSFGKVARYWNQFEGILPPRHAISFRELSGWHDRMIISDLPDHGNIAFRIVGHVAQDIFGGLIRPGGHFDDLPNTLFPDYREYFSMLSRGGTYGRCLGVVPFKERDFLPLKVLDLPAANRDGEPRFLFSFFLSDSRG